ncbi:ABC transporter ATP-binding protein [Streptomyces thinghirensis]|uniref:ABC transporter domain-containing protein n=1 Tax=Streptomyces thinghirensis TaxID=551547 RepID=A0ABP9T4R7_9ACTN
MPNDDPLLTVKNLAKTYRVRAEGKFGHQDFVAVDGVSFDVPAGGSVAIVGESGSGKSTCAKIIVGLESTSAGEVVLAGESWTGRRLRRRDRLRLAQCVQMVFQDPYSSLDPRLTVGQTLTEAISVHRALPRLELEARVGELAEQVGLGVRHISQHPHALSGGERQRVAIARALAAEPQLLILDEAVAALDVSIQAQVLNLLSDIREQMGVALLFISHDLGVVQHLCDDVLVMRAGQVVEQGAASTVLSNPKHPYTQRLIGSVPGPGWVPRRHIISA